MLENNKIIDDIREDLLDRLNDYEGVKTNIYDLGFLLSENENGTGSVFCNTYRTVNYLAENYYDVVEIVDELGDDGNIIDTAIFFDNPETFHTHRYS